MNKDGWEKDTDARRWRRSIGDRRRNINSFRIAIRPIYRPAHPIAVPMSFFLVTAVVMFSHSFMVIFTEGRRYAYTADHCS